MCESSEPQRSLAQLQPMESIVKSGLRAVFWPLGFNFDVSFKLLSIISIVFYVLGFFEFKFQKIESIELKLQKFSSLQEISVNLKEDLPCSLWKRIVENTKINDYLMDDILLSSILFIKSDKALLLGRSQHLILQPLLFQIAIDKVCISFECFDSGAFFGAIKV